VVGLDWWGEECHCVVLCCVVLPGIDVVVAWKICHNMQLTGVV
jgi:hypothetical protein